jgi:SAM-dependent methyltransferase
MLEDLSLNISEKAAWQDNTHARVFDEVSAYPDFLMRRRFESFNEVRLLRENIRHIRGSKLFEVGCATGEFGRYAQKFLPQLQYTGFDISRPAIERAIAKYGDARYRLLEGAIDTFRGKHGTSAVVFCRDVVLHQLNPFSFIASLLQIAEEALVLRLRTREVGETVLDAEHSCQYHYDKHWVPYIVLNTKQLLDHICSDARVSQIIVSRRFEPLGGHNFRHLPKELFYSETGSAETALIVLKQQARPDRARIAFDDRPDGPRYSLLERALLRLARRRLRS